MNQDERLKRLEEQVERQEQQILSMQKQMESLQQGLTSAPQVPQVPQMPAFTRPEPPLQRQPVASESGPTTERWSAEPRAPIEPTDWEHLIGRVWLPRIFILVLLVGVLWGFKAAVNAGYLTEPVRCVLGVLAAGGLIWLGERQIRGDRLALGQVLLGGAVSLLVLTTFAAHVLYDLIGIAPAFVGNVLTVAGGVFLAHRHRSEALGILATVGGFLVPFLVHNAGPNTLFFISYEALVSTAFLLFAWRNNYVFLHYASLLLFHVTALFYLDYAIWNDDRYTMAWGVWAHHVALLVMVLFRRIATGGGMSAITLYTSAVVTIGWWCGLLFGTGVDVELYKGFLLAMTLGYAALAVWRRTDRQQLAVFTSVTCFSLMIYLFNLLDSDYEALALLVEGAITLLLAYYLNARVQLVTGGAIYLIGLLMTVLEPIRAITSVETLTWSVLLASLLVLYVRLRRRSEEPDAEGVIGVGGAMVRSVGVALAVLFWVFLTKMTNVSTEDLSRDGQHMAISFVWALYAIAAIIYGTVRKSQFVRLSGVILLFATLLKLIFVDLPTVSVVVRAILFIGLGAVGVAISRLFYQKKG